jgi:serine/threonine protein kinase
VPSPEPGKFLSRGYQGAVYVQGSGADLRVVKQPMGGRLARRLRAAMLRREFAAYQRVTGIRGIPRCFGLQDDGSLMLEYLPGEAYRETVPALKDREHFFRLFHQQILALHAAGVAHADLKRRGNLLISPDGEPVLLDFGSAVLRSAGGGWLNRLLFRQACRMDLNAWIKLKYRRRFDLITAEDRASYQPTALEAIARVVRRSWRKVTGRRFRKAWRLKRRQRREARRR